MTAHRHEPTADGLGLSFGSAAQRYEHYRADYAPEVFDAVSRYAGQPIRTALEVGAGTGKATRLFASRGLPVTALEPDPRMAALLTASTRDLPVEPIVTTFEAYATARRFDLLYAAAAWHWTDPALRWTKAADLLVPGGVLALLGAPADLADPDLYAAVDELEQRLLPSRFRTAGRPWSIEDIRGLAEFHDASEQRFPRVVTMPADDFVARLSTVSVYLALSPRDREAILDRIRTALPETVAVDAAATVTLARRR